MGAGSSCLRPRILADVEVLSPRCVDKVLLTEVISPRLLYIKVNMWKHFRAHFLVATAVAEENERLLFYGQLTEAVQSLPVCSCGSERNAAS